jgi:hypothetical protein
VSLCVPLSPLTAAATATPLHLIKASVSTSACLLASIIVSLLHACHCTLPYYLTLPHLSSCCSLAFLLHTHFCTLPKHPLLSYLPFCCSSYLHSACALLHLITAFISASAFLLASLIDSLLHVCHHALPYCPTPSHLSSYCPSHFPATCAPLSFSTVSISVMSTLLLSLPSLFCMCTTASHKSVHFCCLLITLFI